MPWESSAQSSGKRRRDHNDLIRQRHGECLAETKRQSRHPVPFGTIVVRPMMSDDDIHAQELSDRYDQSRADGMNMDDVRSEAEASVEHP